MLPLKTSHLAQRSRLFPVLAAVAAVLAACGTARAPAHGADARSSSADAQAMLRDVVTLPAAYGPIPSIAGNPRGDGVWFWDLTSEYVTVFHETTAGRLTSWRVLGGPSYQSGQVHGGFAVSAAGQVWLGVNSTLVRLDAATGRVRTWPIPAARGNPRAEEFQPPPIRGLHFVQALAASDSGQVAIAMSYSSSVLVFDAATGRFSQLAMPTRADEPISLAYAPNGTLATGLADLTTGRSDVAYVKPSEGPGRVRTVLDASAVTAYGSDAFIMGSARPVLIKGNGTTVPLAVPAGSLERAPNATAVAVLPDDQLAAIGGSGLVEFKPLAGSAAAKDLSAKSFKLPDVACLQGVESTGGVVRKNHGTPAHGVKKCQAPPFQYMVTDSAGDVWVVPKADTVALLEP